MEGTEGDFSGGTLSGEGTYQDATDPYGSRIVELPEEPDRPG